MDFQSRSGMLSPTSDPGSDSDGDNVPTRAQRRKSNKPLLEKKRRARINQSLEQLKGLVLEALKKDSARYSKLEKADILEMTVKHLRDTQRHQMSVAMSVDPTVMDKFHVGFSECAQEVERYLGSIDGMGAEMRARLLNHLRTYPNQPHQMSYQSPLPLFGSIPAASQLQNMPGLSMRTPLPFGGLAMSSPEAASLPIAQASIYNPSEFRMAQANQMQVPKSEPHNTIPFVNRGDNSENIAPNRYQRPLAEKTNNENLRRYDRNNNVMSGSTAKRDTLLIGPHAKRVKVDIKCEDDVIVNKNGLSQPSIPHGYHGDQKYDRGLVEMSVKMEPVWRPW